MVEPRRLVPVVDVYARYKAGAHVADLAKEFGFSRSAIHKTLAACGVNLRDDRRKENGGGAGNRRIPDEARARVLELRKAGLSLRAINAETGVSVGAVRQIIAADQERDVAA